MSNFGRFANEGVRRYRSSLHGDSCFLSTFSSNEVLGKNVFIRSKLPTAAWLSQEKREEGVKPTCFMSKATSIPQASHSEYSSPVEALNLIVEWKSLPIEVNNSTIELHLPVEAKGKLAITSSVDFDFLASRTFLENFPLNRFFKVCTAVRQWVTCARNAKKIGGHRLNWKRVENYPDFDNLDHVIQHGLQWFIVKNIEGESTEANDRCLIL